MAFVCKSLGQSSKGIYLIQQCVNRRAEVLGASYLYYLSSLLVLQQWEGEQTEAELGKTAKGITLQVCENLPTVSKAVVAMITHDSFRCFVRNERTLKR